MNETLQSTSDQAVDRLIAGYLQAIKTGKVPSREDLLAQHPEQGGRVPCNAEILWFVMLVRMSA